MKNCPNCQAEVEDNFDLCWKCNYSFEAESVVDIQDERETEIVCLRCKVPMYYEGSHSLGMRAIVESFKKFDLYICPQCGKTEFFLPQEELMKRKVKLANLNKL